MPIFPGQVDQQGEAGLRGPRAERLARMTPEELQEATRNLLDLWRPEWATDLGEGLLLHQHVFGLARKKK